MVLKLLLTFGLSLANNVRSFTNEVVDPNDIFLSNFATHYFSHLDDNRSFNIHGSCGYVAISSFLAFYDTYWNDNLIPEQYDQISNNYNISPGVPSDYIFQNCSASEVYNYITNETYVDDYFQFLLFKIGFDGGFISLSNSTLDVGVVNEVMDYILETYLFDNDYQGFNYNDFYLDTIDSNDGSGTTSADVKTFAVNYVKKGYPVIIGYPGHVSVAYDYDITTNKLYGYMGWNDSGFHQEYNNYSDSWAFSLNYNHFHSNNYYINGDYLCSCQTPYHIHSYDYSYSTINVLSHKAYCFCENYITEPHAFVEKFMNGHRYLCCTKCSYLKLSDGPTPMD